MTPTETATILRQFNEWRRGDEDIPQFDPREIGEAIDAAIAMIEQLEAAESDALEQARLNGMGASREATLMAKLEAAQKEVEIERMRLAACGVAALGYFEGCAEEYISASLNDVLALRAKIEEMEQQEPAGKFIQNPSNGIWEQDGYGDNPDARPLYALPGAKGEGK